ncbi:MAG: hypothetical protein KDA17_06485, partial [Candidatus Saccharibacteria bacterium]|nr:hypothetical protein [Candidatus Saccharibacteria bacterium]
MGGDVGLTERLTVLNNGNVGIGTTAPAGLFDVNNLFTVLSGGNVGIGSTSPNGLFEVAGITNLATDNSYALIGSNVSKTGLLHVSGGVANGGDGRTTELDTYLDSPFLSIGEYQNFLLQTEAFATTWTRYNIPVVTSNSATAPVGTAVAENLGPGTSSDADIHQSVTNSTTGDWNFSVWLKSQDGSNKTVSLRIDSNAESGTASTVTVTPTWQRYNVTQNFTAAHTTKTVYIIMGFDGIAAWGAQLEPTTYPRPYSGARTTSALTALTRTNAFNGALSISGAMSGVTSLSMAGALTGTTTMAHSGLITGTLATTYNSVEGHLLTTANATGVTAALVPVQLSPAYGQIAKAWDVDGSASVFQAFRQEVVPYADNVVTSRLKWEYGDNSVADDAFVDLMSLNSDGSLDVFGKIYGSETLNNPDLTSPGAEWSGANGFSLNGTAAVYLHNASGGTLTQPSASFATPVKANRWYRFTYTTSAINTTARAYIDPSGISATRVYLNGTLAAGTYSTTFKTNASPGDFIIKADSAAAGDGFTLDSFSLVEITSGNITANGLFTGGGTDGIKIDNVGNVGIGSTAPAQKLDVVGNVQFSGALMPNGQAGTSGYVLTSAGAGAPPTWQNPATYIPSYGYWDLQSGALYPKNTTADFLLGASSTASAKLSVTNLNSGTPTLEIKGDLKFGGLGSNKVGTLTSNTTQVTFRAPASTALGLGANGGNSDIYISSGNNVGIGSTSPGYKLDVSGTAGFSSTIHAPSIGTGTDDSVVVLNSSGDLVTDEIDSRVWGTSLVDGSGTANRVAYWTDPNTVAADDDFFFDGTNVGIGTSSPISKFQVTNTSNGSITSGLYLKNATVVDGGIAIDFDNSSTDHVSARINSLRTGAANYQTALVFSTNNVSTLTEAMRINGAGNVGIGSTAPAQKLDVAGNLQFSGALMPNGSAGTSTYLLTSAGAG